MTPSTLRARIAASDGSDQARLTYGIIQDAFDLFILESDHEFDEQEIELLETQFTTMLYEFDDFLGASQLIYGFVFPEIGIPTNLPSLAILDAVCAALERKDETNG